MAEDIKKFNQDEDDFRSEGEVTEERTEEGLIPTHRELIALAKYWARDLLEIEWFFDFTVPTRGSGIDAQKMFANRRINRITKIVGKEKVDEVIEAVGNDFRESMAEELWAIFTHGDDAQRAAVEKETDAILAKDKKRLASLRYLNYPESRSPDRTKEVGVPLTPKELADLEAASRRLAKSPQDIFRRGAALYIQTNRAKRKR
jgi:hypothetical protein